MKYDHARYGDASAAAKKLRKPFRPPDGARFKSVSTTYKDIAVKAVVSGKAKPANQHAVSEAILLGAYRILNLSLLVAPRAGGKKK